VKVRVGVENFHAMALKKFYIVIWSCMKLEDVLEVLPIFMLEFFWIDSFSFGDMNNVLKCLVKLHPQILLSFKRFETCVLCVSWATLSKGGSNITN